MTGFKRNYEKYGQINYEAFNFFWANRLNIHFEELEKIIKKK